MENWKDINADFTEKLKQEWESKGFSYEECKEWIDAGLGVKEADYCAWLRDIKKETPEWITKYQEDYQILSDRFKKYGLCEECNQPNTGEQWCQPCNASHLQKDFTQWTSHNHKIDEFIQKYQLAATEANKSLEWVPYEQFTNIEYLAEGRFGKVYKAKWTVGNIHDWDTEKKQWNREKDGKKNYKMVVLKSLNNSQENIDFLQGIANHKTLMIGLITLCLATAFLKIHKQEII